MPRPEIVEAWCRRLIVKNAGSIVDAYYETMNELHMARYRKDHDAYAFLEEASTLLERWGKVQDSAIHDEMNKTPDVSSGW